MTNPTNGVHLSSASRAASKRLFSSNLAAGCASTRAPDHTDITAGCGVPVGAQRRRDGRRANRIQGLLQMLEGPGAVVDGPQIALLRDGELRIPQHLPEVAVRVLEVASVAAPEGVVGPFYDACARRAGLLHHGVDFLAAVNVVAEAELRRAALGLRDAGIPREVASLPDGEDEAVLQLEEGDGAVLVFRADDAVGGQAEAVAIERDRSLQVVDADG